MSILFFRLNGVPADEADDVRELLAANEIDFYETSAGNWGISLPAIWLHHHDDLIKAQRLFDAYQQQRSLSQRELYLQLKRRGRQSGFWRHNLRHPIRFIGYYAALALTVYVSIRWLFELGL